MTPLLDLKTLGGGECSKNQAETQLYGSIRLYTNQLKAERSKTNQMEATLHDTITGLQKTLEKSAQKSSRNPSLWLDMFTYEATESRRKQNESNGSHLP
jgi:hypothetical protein